MLSVQFIVLQATIGLALVLLALLFVLVAIVFPVIWIFITRREIRKHKQGNEELNRDDYFFSIIKGLGIALLSIIVLAVSVFLLIYFCVDLTIS